VTHAIVLIEAERTALPTLGGILADVEGVAEAYSVTGEWDFVAIVRVPQHEKLAETVTGKIGQLEGVTRTQTMVAFEAFSRHDLEALFSIGNPPRGGGS
jgi:DNA-binding Lrp family transcriptional regulator